MASSALAPPCAAAFPASSLPSGSVPRDVSRRSGPRVPVLPAPAPWSPGSIAVSTPAVAGCQRFGPGSPLCHIGHRTRLDVVLRAALCRYLLRE